MRVRARKHRHKHRHARARARTHTHTQTHTQAHAHTHTHTHVPATQYSVLSNCLIHAYTCSHSSPTNAQVHKQSHTHTHTPHPEHNAYNTHETEIQRRARVRRVGERLGAWSAITIRHKRLAMQLSTHTTHTRCTLLLKLVLVWRTMVVLVTIATRIKSRAQLCSQRWAFKIWREEVVVRSNITRKLTALLRRRFLSLLRNTLRRWLNAHVEKKARHHMRSVLLARMGRKLAVAHTLCVCRQWAGYV